MDGPGNTGNRQARSFHSGTVCGDIEEQMKMPLSVVRLTTA